MYLFDNKEELIGSISPEDLLSHDQTAELNKLITVGASALYSEKLEGAAFVGHRDIDDSNIFHQYKVTSVKSEDGIIDVDGVHTFFDDMKADGYIQDRRPSDMATAGALALILEGSRWTVGTVQSTHSGSASFYYVSRLAAFWEFLETWNVEFKLRMTYSDGKVIGRYVDVYDKLSDDYGKWFEYGDKLIKVSKTEDRQEVYSALLGRGKGEETDIGGYGRKINFADIEWTIANGDPVDKPLGQEYVEIPSATEQYGYEGTKPRIGMVDFPEITDKVQLLEATYQAALEACRPLAEFSATAIETGLSELGETVAIIRDDLNIRYKTRIFKVRRNFLDQKDKQFDFGDKITGSVGLSNVQIKNSIKKQEQRTISWLEVVNAAMMSMFWNEDGYNYTFSATNEYGLPGGFYSFNAPIDANPTKCIYMGAGMLAIANSKLPDGSWNFRTWGTGDGFTADLINAGTIVGTNMTHNLETGVSTYTNAANGDTLSFEQAKIIFGEGTTYERILEYTSEGWRLRPGALNTGTNLNTSLRMHGGITYVDFFPGTGDGDYEESDPRARVESNGEYLYLRTANGESVRVVDWGGNARDIIASGFTTDHDLHPTYHYADRWETPRDGNRSLVISPNGTGKLYVSTPAQDAFYAIWASSFDVSSSIEFKKAIEDYTGNATELINSTPVRLYHLNEDVEGVDIKRLGLIVEESPLEIINTDGGKTIDLYEMATLLWKGNQELSAKITGLEARIAALEI